MRQGHTSRPEGDPGAIASRLEVSLEPEPERGRKAFRHKSCQRRADQPEERGGIRRKVWVEESVPNVEVERRERWLQGSSRGTVGF
jgi:hypothetical protein